MFCHILSERLISNPIIGKMERLNASSRFNFSLALHLVAHMGAQVGCSDQ